MDKETKNIIKKLPGDLKILAEEIGIETTLKIVKLFGGSYLLIPKCEGIIKDIRNNEIRRLYDTGNYTIRDICYKFALTDRTIKSILKYIDVDIPLPLLELMKK